MQTSLKWINELVDIESINLDTLINKLTLGGFEVEDTLKVQVENQTQLALDISATANRSDSLSIQGISTEIATLVNKSTNISNYSSTDFNWEQKLDFGNKTISEEYNCSLFVSVIIENLTDCRVPKWIKQKLISSGVTPVNNLLDFQNYVLLETGYPFAFYDLKKICEDLDSSKFKLSLVKAQPNQEFNASNDLIYTLDSTTTILQANKQPISIAGIIDNKKYQYNERTTSLLIEGSIFDAAMIRQQSRNLGLRTDRSARYEKSLRNTYLLQSLYRLISLLRIANPDLICKLHTIAKTSSQDLKPIFLRYQTINDLLGPTKTQTTNAFSYLQPKTITKYLTQLDCKLAYDKSDQIWSVIVPDVRSNDLTREIDLIEEIGRLHGFNNFLTTLPPINSIGIEDPSYKTRKKITSCLLNLGLTELIHYSLVSENTVLNNKIQLVNPLLSDCSHLRSSLLPSLIKTAQENVKQGNSSLEGFEYGHVFSGEVSNNIIEKEFVAGIFSGKKTKLRWTGLTWFEAKGKIEQLINQLNLEVHWKSLQANEDPIFHPYKSAELLLLTGQKLGIFGQIHPLLANHLTLSPEIYLFEFEIELIQKELQTNKLTIFKEYTSYPKIVKDLSFIISQETSFKELQETLYANGTQFLSEVTLLDDYKGEFIPEGQTSLCFQLIFQSKTKTLENKTIDLIVANLQSVLENTFNAIIRN